MADSSSCQAQGFETLNSKLRRPLKETTIRSIKDLGFKTPTPVQAMCIPLMLSNKDVVAEAVTGSGKTLAFLIPAIEMLLHREEQLKKHEIGALILTPTRELATQISHVLSSFTKNTHLTQLLFVGGKSLKDNKQLFKEHGADIVIATVGRFCALLQLKEENLDFQKAVKSLEILILDEADRLLSQTNCQTDLSSILSTLPKQRRTSLFSATQTDQIESFVRAGLRNPVQVVVREKTGRSDEATKRTPDSLKNFYMVCEADLKLTKLVGFLRMNRGKKTIVFFNTCASVDYFAKLLAIILKNIPVVSIHGQMKKKRQSIFAKFQDMPCGILLCTDVMARGIDVPKVDWVVQYDPPSNADAFVHRCGRTARMGNVGNAIIFLLPNEISYIDFLLINQKVPLTEFQQLPSDTVNVTERIRKISSKNREIYEKGIRAFVSFIQSYRKHECSIIFQFKELNIGKLASGFGLLRLPKMPEMVDREINGFIPSSINVDDIKYADKNREHARQEKLEKSRKAVAEKQKSRPTLMNDSWSKKKIQTQKKMERKEKKLLKRKHTEDENENDNDMDELLREGRLLKKLKKGRITKEQFEVEIEDDLDE